MRAAGEAARSATEPLRDWRGACKHLQASVDGLIGAAAAIKATQAANDQLATRFGNAADRFGGLDQSLAATLSGLGISLHGLQGHVTDFVKDIDTGFSRNVNGLTAIANSLRDSVAEGEGYFASVSDLMIGVLFGSCSCSPSSR